MLNFLRWIAFLPCACLAHFVLYLILSFFVSIVLIVPRFVTDALLGFKTEYYFLIFQCWVAYIGTSSFSVMIGSIVAPSHRLASLVLFVLYTLTSSIGIWLILVGKINDITLYGDIIVKGSLPSLAAFVGSIFGAGCIFYFITFGGLRESFDEIP